MDYSKICFVMMPRPSRPRRQQLQAAESLTQ